MAKNVGSEASVGSNEGANFLVLPLRALRPQASDFMSLCLRSPNLKMNYEMESTQDRVFSKYSIIIKVLYPTSTL